MELKNKKINFLGDSITQGVGTTEDKYIYLNVMKNECGLAAARNYGISGTRIASMSRTIAAQNQPFVTGISRWMMMRMSS